MFLHTSSMSHIIGQIAMWLQCASRLSNQHHFLSKVGLAFIVCSKLPAHQSLTQTLKENKSRISAYREHLMYMFARLIYLISYAKARGELGPDIDDEDNLIKKMRSRMHILSCLFIDILAQTLLFQFPNNFWDFPRLLSKSRVNPASILGVALKNAHRQPPHVLDIKFWKSNYQQFRRT